MGHHTSKSRQPLSATAKVLLFVGAALIGCYGWYTESTQKRPPLVAGSQWPTDPNTTLNSGSVGSSGTPTANPWGSPSPPPSPSDAVSVVSAPVPESEAPGTTPVERTPRSVPPGPRGPGDETSPPPPPKEVHDNAYREKLWASLPQPKAPVPDPLEPLSEPAIQNLRREILAEVRRKEGARSIERIRVTLGTPAKYFTCSDQYREFKNDPQKHSKQLYYLVGQHLLLADAMFAQQEQAVQLSGIGIANEVITVLAQTLKDGPLAARVADAYLIPHLDLAPLKMYAVLNQRFLMTYAIRAYSFGERWDMLERVCGHAIELYGENRNSTDALRITLAKALQKQRKWDKAIQVLNDIQDPSLTAIRNEQLPKYAKERNEYMASQKANPPQK